MFEDAAKVALAAEHPRSRSMKVAWVKAVADVKTDIKEAIEYYGKGRLRATDPASLFHIIQYSKAESPR